MSDDATPTEDLPGLQHIRTRQQLADELTALREQAGLTIRAIARALDIPPGTIGGYFSGRHLPTANQVGQFRQILNVCGVTDPAAIEQWLKLLARLRRTPGKRAADAPAPYPGLASFQPEDAGWFFGREKLTGLLLDSLAETHRTGGPLVVVGPSGSGKSSLLRAGLIPALRNGVPSLPGTNDWPLVLFTPGERPLTELAEQLASAGGAETGPEQLSERASLDDLIERCLGGDGEHGGRGLILVVDQFEEVFTAPCAESERQAFIDALCTPSGPVLTVIGLRADFYSHALQYPELMPALQDHQVVVGPMTEEELRRAIVEPALKANLDLEDGLVELLLRDLAPTTGDGTEAAHEAGALPLLSHVLLTTWERGHRGRLTMADYRDSGGIHGAVARTADDVYASLSAAQQVLARQMFVRLVHLADDTGDTRRRAPRSELLLGGDAQAVLDSFIERRLITADAGRVEMAHEALLSAWPRLRTWIGTDRAGLRIHRQLTLDAEVWRDSGADPAGLYRGGRLSVAREWSADPFHQADLNPLEREFLNASVRQELADARTARRRTRRLQRLLAALTVLSLLSALLATYAFQQRGSAERQRDLAISRQVAVEAGKLRATDVALATQLALAAYRIAPTSEARSSLLESFSAPGVTRVLGPPGVMQTVALTADRRTMATAGADKAVRLWNVAVPGRPALLGRPLTGHTDTVFSVAFSPDGRTLASGSGDRTVRLWDLARPGAATILTGARNTVYSVAFSPDGRTLAAGGADRTVHLWDVGDPHHPAPLGAPIPGAGGFVQSVAFSPDGRTLAAGGADRTVRLWDIGDPHHPVRLGPPLTGAAKTVFSVAFSPDGRTLAAGSADDTVRLWNVGDPRRPTRRGRPLTGPDSFVNSVVFSPDGRSLAAASSDGKVWIWDLAGRNLTTSLPHPGPVTAVVFSHDGRTMATSAADGVARIWDRPGPLMTGPAKPIFTTAFGDGGRVLAVTSADNTARLWNIADPRRPVPLGPTLTNTTRSGRATGAAALSPDARTLAVGGIDGGVQLWDFTDSARPVPIATRLTGPTSNVEGVAFSPNGRVLAITSDDTSVRLWDVADPRHPVRLGRPLRGPTNYAYFPAFSPDGRILAVGSADKTVHLWDVADPRRPVSLDPPLKGHTSYVFTVAFSPDGHTLATAGADDKVQLWDLTEHRHPVPVGPALTGPKNYIFSVAFSPDSRTLAASAGDGTTWLWNVAHPRGPLTMAALTGPSGAVFTNAFDPARPILATAGADLTVRLWNTDTAQVTAYICAVTGTPITKNEWKDYIPGRPYDPPCHTH
ncbi:MAG: transcriptional regulator, family [Actinoallomurus sp.]|nr:transcriptional regulator, family [Actinoallomurus sp.]